MVAKRGRQKGLIQIDRATLDQARIAAAMRGERIGEYADRIVRQHADADVKTGAAKLTGASVATAGA